MPLLQREYEDIRDCMRPGDVIAFSGKKAFSKIIKKATKSNISHVGVVLHTKLEMSGTSQGRLFNQIAEATASGVKFTKLSDIKRNHKGKLWWLPLNDIARAALTNNEKDFFDFLIDSRGKPYDTLPVLIRAWIDHLDRLGITENKEDFGSLFCSELVAGALEKADVISNINASEVTPIDVCRFRIYADDYVQFKGKKKKIRRFNSMDPTQNTV